MVQVGARICRAHLIFELSYKITKVNGADIIHLICMLQSE